MRSLVSILILVLLLATGCATQYSPSLDLGGSPSIRDLLSSHDTTQIQAAAQTDAHADIAAGHPRVCITGTIAAFPVGVPEKYLSEVSKLPRVPLPCGCTEPLVGPASVYAKAYNTEVVHFLKSHHE